MPGVRPRAPIPLLVLRLVLLLAALSAADRRGWLLTPGRSDMAVYHGATARVVRVLDDGTLVVDLPDPRAGRTTTLVRQWGVALDEAVAAAAVSAMGELAVGRTVTLEPEPHRTRGVAGVLLAHVILPDGRALVEPLLEQGLARTDDRWPHARLVTYDRIERRARQSG
jgi:hypothetical protein